MVSWSSSQQLVLPILSDHIATIFGEKGRDLANCPSILKQLYVVPINFLHLLVLINYFDLTSCNRVLLHHILLDRTVHAH
jgi:hypothetical protein